MIDINILKKSWYFKEIHLEKWEVLFNEWEIDNNLYIVLKWELRVEKFTSNKKDNTKILGYLDMNDVIWEASLNSDWPKQARIIASYDCNLLSIWADSLIWDFSIKHKKEAFDLLRYIIYLWNKRLSEANYLITANYTITQEIKNLDKISLKNIFKIIEKLKESIWNIDIVYYEINPVMEKFLTLKYDTRLPWKMQSNIIEITNNRLDLLDLKIDEYFNFTQKLSIWSNNLWYLVFLKKWDRFNDIDRKVLASASSSIAWLIKQKQLLDEDRDKEFMSI